MRKHIYNQHANIRGTNVNNVVTDSLSTEALQISKEIKDGTFYLLRDLVSLHSRGMLSLYGKHNKALRVNFCIRQQVVSGLRYMDTDCISPTATFP